MNNGSKIKNIIIAMLTITILLLTFISSDIGSIFGRSELYFMIKNDLTISTNYTGIGIQPYIEVYNSGKKPERVGRMVAYLCSSTSSIRKVLIPGSFKAFVVFPSNLLYSDYYFSEKLTEFQNDKYGNLTVEITKYFQNLILSDPNYKNNGILPVQLYSKLCATMEENIKWVEHGEYRMLITIYGGEENKKILCQRGYAFRISQIMEKGIKEVQKEYYKIWPDVNPKQYFSFNCIPRLKEITGNDLHSLISDYEKQPLAND
ncbi:MAG: hypothetical protein WC600_14375 [Desulfobaccales bacterium]